MSVGRVKWFSNEKGYGFIETVECAQDVFVHFSEILMDGYKTLKENTMVRFVLTQGNKGPSAHQVDLVTNEDGPWHAADGMAREQAVPAIADMHYLWQGAEASRAMERN